MSAAHLILLAHGSREAAWNAPLERLRARVAEKLGSGAVSLAYLDFTAPTLTEAIASAVQNGAKALCVLPLFISTGGHVLRDVPRLADEARKTHPDVAIEVLPAIGEHAEFADLIAFLGRSHYSVC